MENATVKTLKEKDYNCGGYALETFSWILPCEDEDECAELYDLDIDWEEKRIILMKIIK